MPDLGDDELLRAAKQGDESAFELLCARYAAGVRRRLERGLRGKLRRRVSVADVLQETYLAAHQRLADFEPDGDGAFGRWLDGIASRRLLHVQRFHLGAARRDVKAEITRPRVTHTPDPAAGDASVSQVSIGREVSDAVEAAIETLPQDQQDVVRLVQRGDMTLQEIADLLGRTRNSVKGLQSRALKRLAEILGLETRAP